MNAAYFMAQVGQSLACRHDFARGYRYDNLGRRITGCDECSGCDSKAGRDVLGITDAAEIINDFGQLKLRWPCPRCGFPVHQETTLLNAIADSKEIENDPICFTCRNKGSA